MTASLGWSLPAGVSKLPYDDDGQCEICLKPADVCICPECPTCGATGDPVCYGEHGLRVSKTQIQSRSEGKIAELQQRISDEGMYQDWLADQPDDYTLTLGEVTGQSE